MATKTLSKAAVEIGKAIGKDIGKDIARDIADSSEADKKDRASSLRSLYHQLTPNLHGKQCIIVYPAHDASHLFNNDRTKVVGRSVKMKRRSGELLTYWIYEFDYGEFRLKGDGGGENWLYSVPEKGFKREGKMLTYDER